MAKILKIKAKRTQTARSTHYDYPPEYDAQKIQVLAYETFNPSNIQAVIDRGNKDEYLIGVVRDEDAPAFLVSEDIVEIDYNTAKEMGSRWIKQIPKITDPQKVAKICQKVVNSQILDADELNALDIENPESGIIKSRTFQEFLDRVLEEID